MHERADEIPTPLHKLIASLRKGQYSKLEGQWPEGTEAEDLEASGSPEQQCFVGDAEQHQSGELESSLGEVAEVLTVAMAFLRMGGALALTASGGRCARRSCLQRCAL